MLGWSTEDQSKGNGDAANAAWDSLDGEQRTGTRKKKRGELAPFWTFEIFILFSSSPQGPEEEGDDTWIEVKKRFFNINTYIIDLDYTWPKIRIGIHSELIRIIPELVSKPIYELIRTNPKKRLQFHLN